MAAITFLGVVTKPTKNYCVAKEIWRRMPDNCSRSVVSNYVVFTQWLFPVEEFNTRGFLQLLQWQESGIIYHPFLLRYFGGGRCRYGKLLFTC